MNSTIEYYNKHAEEYFKNTSSVDMTCLYKRFLEYVPVGGRIMDLGCGSGRDVKWFRDHGYQAFGMDASEKLVQKAREMQIPVAIGRIEEWLAEEPFDGIWCCASLIHLSLEDVKQFFSHLKYNLKPSGVLFISAKSGIMTGYDQKGRYFSNYNPETIKSLVSDNDGLSIETMWYTADELGRSEFNWLNAIIRMK